MRKRWISQQYYPKKPPGVAQTTVAGWLPWTYYYVSTFQSLAPDEPLTRLIESISGQPTGLMYVTQILRCNRDEIVTDFETVYYEREYSTLADALRGHEETSRQLFEGKLKLRRVRRSVGENG